MDKIMEKIVIKELLKEIEIYSEVFIPNAAQYAKFRQILKKIGRRYLRMLKKEA